MSELTVTEFVTARISETEAWADDEACKPDFELPAATAPNHPARVLAQCAAMRKILALETTDPSGYFDGFEDAKDMALRALASIWSDHPQFNPAWA